MIQKSISLYRRMRGNAFFDRLKSVLKEMNRFGKTVFDVS